MSAITTSRVRFPAALQRTTRARVLAACLLLLAIGAVAATPLLAHVSLVAASPARNATVDAPPPELRLRFSGMIEPRYTSVALVAPDGTEVPLGAVTFVAGSDREFTVAVPPVRLAGSYMVRWRTAGADGHVLEGSYTFTLAGEPAAWDAADPVTDTLDLTVAPPHSHDDATYDADDVVHPLDTRAAVARWLQFTALLMLVGGFAFRVLLLPRLPVDAQLRLGLQRSAWRAMAGAALLLGAAAVLRLRAQSIALHGAERVWDGALLSLLLSDTAWGRAWLLQALLIALLAVAFVVARPPRDRGALLLALAAVIGLAAVPGLMGHAAAVEGGSVALLNDALHVLAAGAWLGTLAVILFAALPLVRKRSTNAGGETANIIDRFSPLALGAAALVVLTGVINSSFHLRSIGELVDTAYGRVLLVKLGVFVLVLIAGFVNWRIVRPALAAGANPRRLRFSAAAELFLAVLVLVVTAVLTGTARP